MRPSDGHLVPSPGFGSLLDAGSSRPVHIDGVVPFLEALAVARSSSAGDVRALVPRLRSRCLSHRLAIATAAAR